MSLLTTTTPTPGNEPYWVWIASTCEYFYPVLAVCGLFLNFLSLIVLTSKSMRGRTNILLAFIAVFDIFFLCLLSLNMIVRFPVFIRKKNCFFDRSRCMTWLYQTYVKYKSQLTTVINFCSTTSNWLVVVVCVERYLVIKTPLKSHFAKSKFILPGIISLIVVASLGLTGFHNFAFKIGNSTARKTTGLDNGVHSMQPSPNPLYIQIAAVIGVCFQVIIPIFFLVFTNESGVVVT